MRKSYIFIILILLTAGAAFIIPVFNQPWSAFLNWGATSAVLAVLICAALFYEFEASVTSSKEIALIAMLGTISAVLRIPFAAIPSVQPCTFLIICSGYVFGPIAGFAVGAITALASNLFLGYGPWTLYQMIAWGLAGLSSGYLQIFKLNRFTLIIIGIIWGYLFGLITNLWYWTAYVYPLTLNTLLVTQLSSIWFDTLHAIGNAVFLGTIGIQTINILERFKRRFSIVILRNNEIKER